jgi:eukaryotic-like serine/threonine-protein kinase
VPDDIIKFLRRRDYKLIKELGQGACGRTVLLQDQELGEFFVCKKYHPYSEARRAELFNSFIREIKLLHRVLHDNVVRIFNYYIYPEICAGYILMEHIDGSDIDDYLINHPEKINEIFLQTLNGFRHLESNNIMHRDIRNTNILVRNDGVVKIIDLGFGKTVETPADFNKSITLNWWCELPEEFSNRIYDFRSEVYFVGKLFEKIIHEIGSDNFKYKDLLSGMCRNDPNARVQTFLAADTQIQSDKFYEVDFSEWEVDAYRSFSQEIWSHITKIDRGAKYRTDIDRFQRELASAYNSFMLEMIVPDSALVTRCLVDGPYYYRKQGFPVSVVSDFLRLLKSVGIEKKHIILANLFTKLNTIARYSQDDEEPDDIPF